MAVGDSVTFNYTGAVQTWQVPYAVTRVRIECWGAKGGNMGTTTTHLGGKGGYVAGDMNVNMGVLDTFHIYVGGMGANSPSNGGDGGGSSAGGWNGGGSGTGSAGGGGGGATDVRFNGQTNTPVGQAGDYRILVAGGGGGASNGGSGKNGGDPANLLQSTPSGSSASSHSHGEFSADEGGGGGGYYGGQRICQDDAPGAYGGSSFVHSTFTNMVNQAGVNSGHGVVKITILAERSGRRGMNMASVGRRLRGVHTGG